jgi:hypothetical protein
MPTSVTILQLLPPNTGSGNFTTMSPWSITAVSSVCGKQNVQLVSHFLRNLILQPSGSIYLINPTNYFAVSLLLILTLQNLLAHWLDNSVRSTFAVTFLCKFVSFAGRGGLKSESDMSGFLLCSSVTHVLTSFLSLGLEGPFDLLLPAMSPPPNNYLWA